MKLKTCAGGCNNDRPVWKRHKGKPYCKTCWSVYKYEHPDEFKQIRIKKISDKAKNELSVYSMLRRVFFNKPENQYCKANLVNCTKLATDVHHSRGRGKWYLIVTTWLPVCRNCHSWITEHSSEAIELGLSEYRLKNYDETNEKTDSD